MKRVLNIFLFSLLVSTVSLAQSPRKKADDLYDKRRYAEALQYYQQALAKEPTDDNRLRIASSYVKLNQPAQSLEWFDKINNKEILTADDYREYGEALMIAGRRNEALTWFKKLPNDEVAKNKIQALENFNSFYEDSSLFRLYSLDINSADADFAPQFFKDGIVFISSRVHPKSNENKHEKSYFMDLYYAGKKSAHELNSPEYFLFHQQQNSEYHEGPLAFNAEGNKMIFTQNFEHGDKPKKGEDNTIHLHLFSAEKTGANEWGKVEKLNINDPSYSSGYPTLTSDFKTMYFLSNMPGGLGGTDIYKSVFTNGQWSKPENLGSKINTKSDEMSPYLANDSTLFFASEGHPGMGGLDVFYATLTNGQFDNVKNLGAPLNSSYDDFSLIIDDKSNIGYISSNRPKGKGSDDIYQFEIIKVKYEGLVVSKHENKPLKNAEVKVVDKTNENVVKTTASNESGKFNLIIETVKDFSISAKKEGYDSKTLAFHAPAAAYRSVKYILPLDSLVMHGKDTMHLQKKITLNNIYFDLNEAKIKEESKLVLNEVVKVLNENPDLQINVYAHSDSRGNNDYNLDLSKKRAASTTNYLVEQGIDRKRIISEGYGEQKLINECKDGVECSEEKHLENRRIEFFLVK